MLFKVGRSNVKSWILLITGSLATYGGRPLPKLTFIVVKKRHNTRFFIYDGQATKNVEAGTVVDQQIVHPSQFDFYLCSQAAL